MAYGIPHTTMGSSSKKKRGKQRKAARNKNFANNNTIATTNGSGTGSNWLAETLIVQTIKEHIQRANDDATVGLINFPIPLNMQSMFYQSFLIF